MEIDYQSRLEASLQADPQLLTILVSNLLSNATWIQLVSAT